MNTIQFSISKRETQDIAEAIQFPIVTQAKTLGELMKNIQEATELYFQA